MGFGLERQYGIIGQELLDLESQGGISGKLLGGDRFAMAALSFREAVVFVSVEVLEAYLEDLLNVKVSERRLCIKRTPALRGAYLAATIVLVAGCGVVVCGWWNAALTLKPFLTASSAALATLLLWLYFPRATLARRIAFARLVSYEICRRRGRKPEVPADRSGFLESLLGEEGGSCQGVTANAARKVRCL